MQSGVYSITSPSGNLYIGSATDFARRFSGHKGALRRGNHHSKALQAAANKYGIENLKFAKVLICEKKDLLMYEQIAIDALGPAYNACPVAGSRLGATLTDEHKAQISKVHTGKAISESHRAAVSKAHLGVKRSEETRAKISEAAKNRSISPETRAKMLASRALYYARKRGDV